MRKIKCDNIQCRRADTCANYLPWEPCTISRFDNGDSCPHYRLSEGQTPVGNFDCERCYFSEACVFFSSLTVKDQLNSKIKII